MNSSTFVRFFFFFQIHDKVCEKNARRKYGIGTNTILFNSVVNS